MRKAEFSYFSVVLLLWSLFFVVYTHNTDLLYASSLLTLVCVCNTVWYFNNGKLILSFLLLSELCYSLREDSVYPSLAFFYASLQLSCTCMCFETVKVTSWCRTESRKFLLLAILCLIQLLLARIFIVEECYFQVTVFLIFAHVYFGILQPLIGVEESSLVSCIISFYAADFFCSRRSDCPLGFSYSVLQYESHSVEYIISREVLVWSFLFTLVVSLSLVILHRLFQHRRSGKHPPQGESIIFWICLGATVCIWWRDSIVVLQLDILPLTMSYISDHSVILWIVSVWAICIPTCVLFIHLSTQWMRKTIRRKLFHFLAVYSFTLPTIVAPEFLCMCVSIMTSIFVVIEVGRFHDIWGFHFFSQFMRSHIDSRESINGVVRSHIYLTYGFGMSLYFSHRFLGHSSPAPLSFITNLVPGVVSLGVVDTMAAIGGSILGKTNKLSVVLVNKHFPSYLNPSVEHKSFVGVLSGALCGVIFWWCTQEMMCIYFVDLCPHLVSFCPSTFLMIVAVSIFESLSDGIDNLELPLLSLSIFYTIAPVHN